MLRNFIFAAAIATTAGAATAAPQVELWRLD